MPKSTKMTELSRTDGLMGGRTDGRTDGLTIIVEKLKLLKNYTYFLPPNKNIAKFTEITDLDSRLCIRKLAD